MTNDSTPEKEKEIYAPIMISTQRIHIPTHHNSKKLIKVKSTTTTGTIGTLKALADPPSAEKSNIPTHMSITDD